MTQMGDATSQNVPALVAVSASLDYIAGYVTGSVKWSLANWAVFPGKTLITIDQGSTGSPVPSAVVRDFEQGAWTASQSNEDTSNGTWTAERPTIYSDQSNLPAIVADGWRRDLWVAIVGWQPGDSMPPVVQSAIDAGCNVVAIQNQQNVGGTIDLSIVLDSTWPNTNGGTEMYYIIGGASDGAVYLYAEGKMSHLTEPSDIAAWTAVGAKSVTLSAGTVAQMLTDYPPGNPTVEMGNVVFPTYAPVTPA